MTRWPPPTGLPAPPPARPGIDAGGGYTVVARRYRPQQFADLIGQEHVAAALTNALTTGRVAHAYLFTGARGTGKTSTARILAKAMNCVRGPTPTPCDECPICLGIIAGDDADVVEIDAASNTGVDNIRELRANAGYRPQRSRYKVYVIDEVHMLSNSAFNALLKTLEEPPPHVKFIFATTEIQKIPVTILSRCQRFDFAPIGPAKVFATLKHIAAKEGIGADDDALRAVSRRAGGSMRDAQTLLDQLLGAVPGRLTAAAVHALLGTAGDDQVAAVADAVFAGDAGRAVRLVGEAADGGRAPGEVADQLVDYWRGLMLVAVAGADARDLPGTPALHEAIRAHAAGRSLDTILAGLDVLTTAKARMRGSPHAQVLLEVAAVRLSRLDDLLSVGRLAQLLGDAPAPRAEGRPPVVVAGPPLVNGTPRPPVSREGLPGVAPAEANGVKKNGPVTANGTHPAVPAPTPDLTTATLPGVWPRVLQEVGPMRGKQLELAGPPAITGPRSLIVRFPANYTSAYDGCGSEAGTEVLRAALKRVTGGDWHVRVEQAPPDPPPAAGDRPGPAGPVDRKKELLGLPLFKRAADVFGAKLLQVDDGFDPAGGDPAAVPLVAAGLPPDTDEG